MDPTEHVHLTSEREPDPSPAALRLAAALAERLDAVVPRPFRVRAEGDWVSLYHGEEWDSSSGVATVLDQVLDAAEGEAPEESPVAARVESIAWSVLSSVQDGIAEATTEPWPALPQGGMADPGTRTDGDQVHLWYGPIDEPEAAAVVSFPPISLRKLVGTGGTE